MKKNILAFAIVIFSITTSAQTAPPVGNADLGDSYGQQISESGSKNAISANELNQKLKKKTKIENVSVKGKVTDVCPKKGCWFTIAAEDGTNFFVKMKDYAFFVPTTLKGKTIILEGDAENKTTSVDELKHYAEDAKKSKEEIDNIKEPKVETKFLASGIKVVE